MFKKLIGSLRQDRATARRNRRGQFVVESLEGRPMLSPITYGTDPTDEPPANVEPPRSEPPESDEDAPPPPPPPPPPSENP